MNKNPHTPTKPKLWLAKYIATYYAYNKDGTLYNQYNGNAIGNIDVNSGYCKTTIKGRKVYVHHIVWFLCKRYWPKLQLDHIDKNRANNKIENLREVTSAENSKNVDTISETGYKGVYQVSLNTFQAQIWFRRKRYCLGSFYSKKDAHEEFKRKYKELHGVEY